MADIKTDSLSTVLKERVLKFIKKFTLDGKRNDVIECFTSGCCYWFALILSKRFVDGEIVYDQVANHYGYCIYACSAVFDITGDVTDKYNWENWSDVVVNDPALATKLFNNCIAMTED